MASSSSLDLSALPPMFILSTHLQNDELHEAENGLHQAGGHLSYDAKEARIFLGKISQKKRAAFDLRSRGVWTEETEFPAADFTSLSKRRKLSKEGTKKEERISASETDTDIEDDNRNPKPSRDREQVPYTHGQLLLPDLESLVLVLKLDWLEDCISKNKLLPFSSYLIYSGRITTRPKNEGQLERHEDSKVSSKIKQEPTDESSDPSRFKKSSNAALSTSILERAKADAPPSSLQPQPFHRRLFSNQHKHKCPSSHTLSSYSNHIPKLNHASTSEYESLSHNALPTPPSWISEPHPKPLYSCLRSTPPLNTNPNKYFIRELEKIKQSRLLTLDEIGVRAYSTSIASLSAYPHHITNPLEIIQLPGCNDKIASLWIDYHNSISSSSSSPQPDGLKLDQSSTSDEDRFIPMVKADIDSSPDLQHLSTFYSIWGVGAETARKFYYTLGWKDLDDVVEQGWNTVLSRVQQIGVKFYDEFKEPIPRSEVEEITRIVLRHARQVRNIPREHWGEQNWEGCEKVGLSPSARNIDGNKPNQNFQNSSSSSSDSNNDKSDPRDFVTIIVGSYRRGAPSSSDVDIILSHRDPRMTKNLIIDLVDSLEQENYITHTLSLQTSTSDRDQSTLPYHADTASKKTGGFDSLDKALCVWQDPNFPSSVSDPSSSISKEKMKEKEKEKDKLKLKNPNIHRRVDIIVSPWKTVGCAVLGWSGGTTFQRDIRRWVKRERGWKFDSSGVRDRRSSGKEGGQVIIGLEEPRSDDEADTWWDRERRLMVGLGIGYRPAGERCTG